MAVSKVNILIILPCYSIKWGGPGRVVYDICKGLKERFNFTILTTYYAENDKTYPIPTGVQYVAFPMKFPISKIWRSYNPDIAKWLEANYHKYNLIHIHELWLYTQFVAARKANKYKIPYILTPHGELDDWRLNHKKFRKQIFGFIFQKQILKNAVCIHALTKYEEVSILQFTNKIVPIKIIPNSLPDAEESVNATQFKKPEKPFILFMGRIQIVKGCLELIKAYTKWQGNHQYDLIFAGEFEGENYKTQMLEWVEEHNLKSQVSFVGLVTGTTKLHLLRDASLFVLPSYSEGFSIAILEAMKASCPILVSRNTGIQDVLEDNNAGFLCDSTPESILNGLNKFLSSNISYRLDMAERALNLFTMYYSMEMVLNKYENLYNTHAKNI